MRGRDADPDGNQTINCWRSRIEAGDTQIFNNFCHELSDLISRLQLNEAFIVGVSRGGYVAATCAANDPRITKVVLLKPVTDLQLLAEFAGYTVDESIFGLAATVPALSQRSVLLRIGPNDTRVSTESALAYGEAIGAEVQVVPSEGHNMLDDGTTTQWLLRP